MSTERSSPVVVTKHDSSVDRRSTPLEGSSRDLRVSTPGPCLINVNPSTACGETMVRLIPKGESCICGDAADFEGSSEKDFILSEMYENSGLCTPHLRFDCNERKKEVFVSPAHTQAITHINGKLISGDGPTLLNHKDFLILGTRAAFQFVWIAAEAYPDTEPGGKVTEDETAVSLPQAPSHVIDLPTQCATQFQLGVGELVPASQVRHYQRAAKEAREAAVWTGDYCIVVAYSHQEGEDDDDDQDDDPMPQHRLVPLNRRDGLVFVGGDCEEGTEFCLPRISSSAGFSLFCDPGAEELHSHRACPWSLKEVKQANEPMAEGSPDRIIEVTTKLKFGDTFEVDGYKLMLLNESPAPFSNASPRTTTLTGRRGNTGGTTPRSPRGHPTSPTSAHPPKSLDSLELLNALHDLAYALRLSVESVIATAKASGVLEYVANMERLLHKLYEELTDRSPEVNRLGVAKVLTASLPVLRCCMQEWTQARYRAPELILLNDLEAQAMVVQEQTEIMSTAEQASRIGRLQEQVRRLTRQLADKETILVKRGTTPLGTGRRPSPSARSFHREMSPSTSNTSNSGNKGTEGGRATIKQSPREIVTATQVGGVVSELTQLRATFSGFGTVIVTSNQELFRQLVGLRDPTERLRKYLRDSDCLLTSKEGIVQGSRVTIELRKALCAAITAFHACHAKQCLQASDAEAVVERLPEWRKVAELIAKSYDTKSVAFGRPTTPSSRRASDTSTNNEVGGVNQTNTRRTVSPTVRKPSPTAARDTRGHNPSPRPVVQRTSPTAAPRRALGLHDHLPAATRNAAAAARQGSPTAATSARQGSPTSRRNNRQPSPSAKDPSLTNNRSTSAVSGNSSVRSETPPPQQRRVVTATRTSSASRNASPSSANGLPPQTTPKGGERAPRLPPAPADVKSLGRALSPRSQRAQLLMFASKKAPNSSGTGKK